MTACIGEPISWPRLEAFARAKAARERSIASAGGAGALAPDAAVTAHVAECAACRACLAEIEGDIVGLRALPAAPPRKQRWWMLGLVPALAAVALLLFVLRPRDDRNLMHVKGVGEVQIELVRERDGVITYDSRTFMPTDRWKVVVTCSANAHMGLTVDVRDGHTIDHPLPPAYVGCGNRVVVPGAFTLDGKDPNRVCVYVEEESACVTVRPE
jgi:hypothetical protein